MSGLRREEDNSRNQTITNRKIKVQSQTTEQQTEELKIYIMNGEDFITP